jgi:nucleotide-binding universal stress UspA family protein
MVGMTIIAAVDLSSPSVNAARSAIDLARVLRDDVLLLQALQPMSMFYPEAAMAGAPDIDQPLFRATEEALDNLRLALGKNAPGVRIEKRVVFGRPHEVLCQAAREVSARLIVMGTMGRGPGGRLLVGSVAQRTVREAPCPVLVLRDGKAPFATWGAGQRPLRVLAGVDHSPATGAALALLGQWRACGPCDVTLVHEYWPPREYARLGLRGSRELDRDDPEVIATLDRDLRLQLPHLGGSGQVALRIRAGWGPVGEQLAMEAEAEAADLLVLGTGQPHGLDRLRTGSASLSALHASEIPLLVVPAGRGTHPLPAQTPIPLIRSVLVATDFSELGNAAVPHAYSLVRPAGRVELCHVHEHALSMPAYVVPDQASLPPQKRRELELQLTGLIPAQAAEMGITSHATVIDGGSAAEQILAAARRLGVDTIVVASHGRSGIGRALLGSVAEVVVRGSERPVYVVRPGAASKM